MKPKTLYLLLLFTCIFHTVFANRIEKEAAKEMAMKFLSQRQQETAMTRGIATSSPVELSLVRTETHQGDTVYYAFNNLGNAGFVVVSAVDNVPEILCYSDEGSFDVNKMSVGTRSMLLQYAEYISKAQQGFATAINIDTYEAPISKMIHTQWGQGDPYNRKSPGVTGCVATAMAQLMNYYKWPQTGTGTKTYLNNKKNKNISVSFGSEKYEYDLMLAKLEGAPQKVQDAVSLLMYHAGVAAETQYGDDESAAYVDVALKGMIDHFRYDPNARLESASKYSASQWESLIYNELAQGRPVIYSGQYIENSTSVKKNAMVLHLVSGKQVTYDLDRKPVIKFSGEDMIINANGYFDRYKSDDVKKFTYSLNQTVAPETKSLKPETGGHSFIIDGYENGYFHVNWGWDGAADGYYLLTSMLGYNDQQGAFIGLKPVEEQTIPNNRQFAWGYCDDAINPYYGGDGTIGGAIKIPSNELQALIGKEISGVEIGLADEVNNLHYYVTTNLDYNSQTRAETNSILAEGVTQNGNIGWNNLKFDKPVAIEGKDLYIVYTCENIAGHYPVAISGRTDWSKDYEGKTSISLYQGNWEAGKSSESLCIRAIIQNENITPDIRLTKVDDVSCHVGDNRFYITGSVENMSSVKVENYTVAYQIDDNDVQYYKVNCNLKTNELGRFSVPVSNSVAAGIHSIKAWVDKVNGEPDAVPANSNYYKTNAATLKVHGKTFARRNVMESYIATSCVYSPRAILADRYFREKYPYNYIGINIHEKNNCMDDPMGLPDNYEQGLSTPTTFINRKECPNSSLMMLETAFATEADFDLSIESTFTSDDKQTLYIKSKVVPGMTVSGQYRMAYVIVEDNVGPYYQAASTYVYYDWEDGESTIFDGVARGIYPTNYGMGNSLPTSMVAGSSYEHAYTLTLPNNIDNIDNIKIVGLIINQSTGEIENAAYSVNSQRPNDTILLFDKDFAIMSVGAHYELEVTSIGISSDAQLVWSSSDPTIASVSSTGDVKALSKGSVDISVLMKDHPDVMTSCHFEVLSAVDVKTAGTLSDYVGDKMYDYVSISIKGDLNGDDLLVLRKMAGCGFTKDEQTDGRLEVIDLSEASFVEGGGSYFYHDHYSGLYNLELKTTNSEISLAAFAYCPKLKEFVCPKTTYSIKSDAFSYCPSLKKLVLNEGLGYTETMFWNNGSLTELYIPSTVYDIRLVGAENLTNVLVDSRNLYFKSIDGILYDFNIETLCGYPGSKPGDVYISPNSVTKIEPGSFIANKTVKRLYLPGVQDVGGNDRNNIEFVYFGPNTKWIEPYFINGCLSLATIVCAAATPPAITAWNYIDDDLYGCNNKTLYVPKNSIDAYKSAHGWSNFGTILPLEEYSGDDILDSLTSIENVQDNVNATIENYDLLGRPTENNVSGITIHLDQNGKTIKLLLKPF